MSTRYDRAVAELEEIQADLPMTFEEFERALTERHRRAVELRNQIQRSGYDPDLYQAYDEACFAHDELSALCDRYLQLQDLRLQVSEYRNDRDVADALLGAAIGIAYLFTFLHMPAW